MNKQLSIFSVEPEIMAFMVKAAHVKKLKDGTLYTDVVVHIPKQAKSLGELRRTNAYDPRYDLFDGYQMGLWSYERVKDKCFHGKLLRNVVYRPENKPKQLPYESI